MFLAGCLFPCLPCGGGNDRSGFCFIQIVSCSMVVLFPPSPSASLCDQESSKSGNIVIISRWSTLVLCVLIICSVGCCCLSFFCSVAVNCQPLNFKKGFSADAFYLHCLNKRGEEEVEDARLYMHAMMSTSFPMAGVIPHGDEAELRIAYEWLNVGGILDD